MFIETRVLGKKNRLLDRWSVPVPPDIGDSGDGGITLRALISRIVRDEVDAFRARERRRRLAAVLSASAIADGAESGKVDPGGRRPAETVDPDAAVGTALQSFEDGLYLVIIDGVEQRELDRQIYPSAETTLVFLRLTFLAGA